MNNLLVYIFNFMNIISFLLMAYDKRASIKKRQRISEATFMVLTILGGIVGILLAALMFNHKVSKRSFQIKISLMFIIFVFLMYNLIDFI